MPVSPNRFSFAARLRSVRHALAGLRFMLTSQPNARLHLVASVAVVGLGLIVRLGADDWKWLTLTIALVWLAEAMNTAFEHLCDVVSPEFHPLVKQAKDVAAAGVLLTALGALVLGGLVFWPYFFR